jgi:hypothetical protein
VHFSQCVLVLAEFEPIDAPTECSNEDKTKEESKRSGTCYFRKNSHV